jgi:glycosyltransferase involved in cell wall biosynthesis
MPIAFNEINEKSNGGTEQMARRVDSAFEEGELDHVQIIPSRVRQLDDDKVRIFWCHDLPNDPESTRVLENNGWKKFNKIVFVSHWQKQQYMNAFEIPAERCTVLLNAIEPFDMKVEKPDPSEKIKLIYHTTPHRGLDIAYYAIDALSKDHPEIEFTVYSSFRLYGWGDRDEHFKELFQAIQDHPNMIYRGTVPNKDVRDAVAQSHIFAYPSTWPETSCISLMEAMSAGLLCVHPDLAALPETAANWTYMYGYNDDKRAHLDHFASCVDLAIRALKSKDSNIETRLNGQRSYANIFYNWDLRKVQWRQLIESMKDVKPYPVSQAGEGYEIEEFSYSTAR